MEKSVEIKLKSWEIKADFLEIKLRNQPNIPSSPTHFYNVQHHFWGKSQGNLREIRKSRTPKLLVADPSISTEAETLPGPSLLRKLDVGKVPMKWIDSTSSKLYVLLCLIAKSTVLCWNMLLCCMHILCPKLCWHNSPRPNPIAPRAFQEII